MKHRNLLKTMLLLCALIAGTSSAWADPVTLFHESFGNNSGSARAWDNSYSVKSGVSAVYTGITGYTVSNAKQGKNTTGSTQSGLIQSSSGTDAYIIIGPLDVQSCESMTLTYQWKAGSIKATYTTKAYYATSAQTADGTWTEVSGTGTGATSFVERSYSLPAAAQVSTLYLKIVWNTSNTQAIIDEVDLSGTYDDGGNPTVVTPVFDPDGSSTYTTAQTVKITCETTDATIYYTTDGTDPDDSSTEYSTPISITTSGTVLKAIAYKDGMTESSVASATYTIKPTKPTISAEGATVTISGSDGCTFYYTTDGTEPKTSSTTYTAPFDLFADCTIKAIAYDTYGNSSDASSFSFKYMPLAPKNINSGYYEKVTDVSSLENGDAILIVNVNEEEDNYVAMSTTQNNNNRGKVDIDIITSGAIYSSSDAETQKLILVKKTEAVDAVDQDVFYFYTGSGYLYAASSTSNYLKTEATPDDNNNARATISITDGIATITFKGSNTRRLMQYNSGSSLFACYSSSQAPIQIYKEVAHSESVKLNAFGYATFASPCSLDFSDDSEYSAWQITGVSGSTITFAQITGAVAAGTGVLLKGEASETISIPVANSGSDISSTNKLEGYTESKIVGENAYYGLSGNSFKRINSGTVPAGKALLPASEVGAGVKAFTFVFEDDATSIEETLSDSPIKGENIYNLAGQRLNKMQKGINIVNGKKIMVK